MIANKRFLTTVCSFMYFWISCLGKGLVTLLALKWLLTSVHSFMCFQTSCPAKGLVTLLALKRLPTTFVSFQFFCLAKRLDTMLALKWLLTMYFQISCLAKGLLTCGCGCKHLTFFFYNSQICIKAATNALEISATKKYYLHLQTIKAALLLTAGDQVFP